MGDLLHYAPSSAPSMPAHIDSKNLECQSLLSALHQRPRAIKNGEHSQLAPQPVTNMRFTQ